MKNLLLIILLSLWIGAATAQTTAKTTAEYVSEARAKYAKKDMAGGKWLLSSALQKDSNDRDANYYMGIYYLHARHYRSALDIFSKLVVKNPMDTMALFKRAQAYRGLGEQQMSIPYFELAIKDYDKVLTMQPDMSDAYFNRGMAKKSMGWWQKEDSAKKIWEQEAIKDLKKVLELNPNDKDALSQFNATGGLINY